MCAGAVGRVNVVGPKGQQRMVIDLKGLPCNATLHPLAGTFCLANIGQEEAKIEAVMTSFISLCPDATAAAELRCHDVGTLSTLLSLSLFLSLFPEFFLLWIKT